jgi:Flp pilus assembly protein TadG
VTRRARLARDEGQVLPLLLVGLLVVLLGISALVIDVGQAYVLKRKLQATADATALAAADVLPDVGAAGATADAFGPANKNPVAHFAVTQTVTPYCLRSVAYCYGNPAGTAPANGQANGVVVTEAADLSTTFARVLGLNTIHVTAKATACGLCGATPVDIALVVDRTGSMVDNMADLRNGVKTFLQTLDPRLDWVTLLVLPPLGGRGACDPAWSGSAYPLQYGNSYPTGSDDTYTVVRLSHDYRNADGTLNTGSALVSAVNCLQPAGSTSYRQALEQAQAELVDHGSGRPDVQRVIVFESDGAANTTPSSQFDASLPTATVGGNVVYQPRSGYSDEVMRPCGSAVDYSRGAIQPAGTTVFTVAYAVYHDDNCYQAPHAEQRGRRMVGIDYRQVLEGLSAQSALQQIASPGDAFAQASEGDMSAVFARIANKILGAKLVPDSEGP